MSESVQHADSARHSTTGDVYCMRAVPVTPRQVMFTVCGQCPSVHAEGFKKHFYTLKMRYLAMVQNVGVRWTTISEKVN